MRRPCRAATVGQHSGVGAAAAAAVVTVPGIFFLSLSVRPSARPSGSFFRSFGPSLFLFFLLRCASSLISPALSLTHTHTHWLYIINPAVCVCVCVGPVVVIKINLSPFPVLFLYQPRRALVPRRPAKKMELERRDERKN